MTDASNDTNEYQVSFEERQQWVGMFIGLVAMATYFVIIAVRAQSVPLTEVSWGMPMLWTVVIGGGAFGVAYWIARSRHRGGPASDSRDLEINRFGEYAGRGLVDFAVVAAVVMLALDVNSFWVAHTLFLGGYLGSLIGTVAKIAAYRGGIPS